MGTPGPFVILKHENPLFPIFRAFVVACALWLVEVRAWNGWIYCVTRYNWVSAQTRAGFMGLFWEKNGRLRHVDRILGKEFPRPCHDRHSVLMYDNCEASASAIDR
jgi:hypothetical protein